MREGWTLQEREAAVFCAVSALKSALSVVVTTCYTLAAIYTLLERQEQAKKLYGRLKPWATVGLVLNLVVLLWRKYGLKSEFGQQVSDKCFFYSANTGLLQTAAWWGQQFFSKRYPDTLPTAIVNFTIHAYFFKRTLSDYRRRKG